jgi:N4-(beta-N-acetylglucosaminyl)-L-asparaginase
MTLPLDRRSFMTTGLAIGALSAANAAIAQAGPPGPKAISSENGLQAVAKAVERMRAGDDPLDAAIAGVNLVEDDPNDHTVGLGGIPNERGIVELDSAVMHGPTAMAGSVASLRNIRNPSKVARVVMQRSDHVLLVGEGALEFARAHGFKEEDLLTDEARQIWLHWKETLSEEDDWIPPPSGSRKTAGHWRKPDRPTGTIHLSAIDANGNLGSVTTTSGLWFKIPGRVGDSPILGAGLYTDNEVGSAGSTGRGEANLLTCASFFIVERMRAGRSPEEACLDACQRVVDKTKDQRLLDDDKRPNFNVAYYAINKKGEFGSASIHEGKEFTVHDGQSARLLPSAYLFKKKS